MRFCSWGLSFWFSSWAWEAFAGMSLQRTRVHASCSRYSRREPGPRAQGRGPVAQGPRPVARAVVQTPSKFSLIGPKLADPGTWQIPGGSGRPWSRLSSM